jgi:hypothetical protein
VCCSSRDSSSLTHSLIHSFALFNSVLFIILPVLLLLLPKLPLVFLLFSQVIFVPSVVVLLIIFLVCVPHSTLCVVYTLLSHSKSFFFSTTMLINFISLSHYSRSCVPNFVIFFSVLYIKIKKSAKRNS